MPAKLNASVPQPMTRRLRTFTLDPGFAADLDTVDLSYATLEVPWEPLKPGPVGAQVAVLDPGYAPVDLDDPRLVASDGFAPSEGNPQFHQQAVYAASMRVIRHFEKSLGRAVRWRGDAERLRILPHAFEGLEALYDPQDVSLRFGYAGNVFTCLSQDIVVHETVHALLDGMHRGFLRATNPDSLAFHEGFADLIALLMRLTDPCLVADQLTRNGGDLEGETLLGALATQVGRASGRSGALRSAIGAPDAAGVWRRHRPDPAAYRTLTDPHQRGSILVAAVFDAFIGVWKRRSVPVRRLGWTNRYDLSVRLAMEACRTARHLLRICIRALDYLPPVDLTFEEYLRGLVTADRDLIPVDNIGYRVAFVEAFRRHGIVSSISEEQVLWEGTDVPDTRASRAIVARLRKFSGDAVLWDRTRLLARREEQARRAIAALIRSDVRLWEKVGVEGDAPFEVTELRCAQRPKFGGGYRPQAIVGIVQERDGFPGGSTLIVDLAEPRLQYSIRKRIDHEERHKAFRDFTS